MSIYLIIAGIVTFLAVLAWDVITDYQKWLNEHKVVHKSFSEFGVRVLLLIIPGILFFLAAHNETPLLATAKVFVIGSMIGFNFFNFFDGIYNLARGYNWFFTGSDDEDDADTDNFLQSIPLWLHIFFKVGGSAISIFLYTLFF